VIPGERLRPSTRVIEPIGYIDNCSRGEVRGWIIDKARPNEYVYVCLHVNGNFVAKACAYHYRHDIQVRFGTSGLCGFSFPLPEWAQAEHNLLVEVRLEDGRHIGHSPYQFRRGTANEWEPAFKRSGPPSCTLFLHIPKCGGTTLAELLRANATLSERVFLYPQPPGIPPEDILYLTESQLSQMRCAFGHFAVGLHYAFPRPARYITVVREPVSRVYSHYFHIVRNEPERLANRKRSLVDFFRQPPMIEFDNLMVRLLAAADEDGTPLGGVDEGIFSRALHNLEKHFAFIGLQEKLSETRERLRTFELFKRGELGHENPGNLLANSRLDPAILSAIRQANSFDVRLYDYAVGRFRDAKES
jgi:hypothetical protein